MPSFPASRGALAPFLLVAALAAACRTTSPGPPEGRAALPGGDAVPVEPAAPIAGAPASAAPSVAMPGCPDDPAAATVDANLLAMVSQGEALPDHVGPAAARAIFADLDRDPARYLDRFECRFVSSTPSAGYDSLLLAVPLWRLRRHDAARVAALAGRVVLRYEELARTPPDPAVDPSFAARVAGSAHTMSLIADGLDVPPGPRWKPVRADDVAVCLTALPDATTVLQVTRTCSCGETLSCRAVAGSGGMRLEVRFDPDSPARCTDCYPTSTSCTLPALPPRASVRVSGDVATTTWKTDDRGWPVAMTCAP